MGRAGAVAPLVAECLLCAYRAYLDHQLAFERIEVLVVKRLMSYQEVLIRRGQKRVAAARIPNFPGDITWGLVEHSKEIFDTASTS